MEEAFRNIEAPDVLELAQVALQPLAPGPQGLVDRLGRRGEPALQDRQREADRARPLGVGERLGAIEFLAHVVGDGDRTERLSSVAARTSLSHSTGTP